MKKKLFLRNQPPTYKSITGKLFEKLFSKWLHLILLKKAIMNTSSSFKRSCSYEHSKIQVKITFANFIDHNINGSKSNSKNTTI